MAFATNFKWEAETSGEYRDRRKAEKRKALQACYDEVDERDELHSRDSGVRLVPGSVDEHKRLERHHMATRGAHPELRHESGNVISLSGFEHAQVKAGKVRYSGDANLRDADGQFCGVTKEVITESGWQIEKLM